MDATPRKTYLQVTLSARHVPNDKRVDNTLWHWQYCIEMGW